MGFRFRKRIKIAPGLSINVSSKGVTSASVGRQGASLNIGKNGVQASASIPNTGISYTRRLGQKSSRKESGTDSVRSNDSITAHPPVSREVSFPLGLGIFLMPYIFAWILLQAGYTQKARYFGFGWLLFVLIVLFRKQS